jgi:hypothetical protein
VQDQILPQFLRFNIQQQHHVDSVAVAVVYRNAKTAAVFQSSALMAEWSRH